MGFKMIINSLNLEIKIYPFKIDVSKNLSWKEDLNIENSFWNKDSPCKDNESKLYDSLVTGAYNQVGVPGFWYKVSYSTKNEKVFGEDNDREILRKFEVTYYVDELPEDNRMYSSFGIFGLDTFHIYISKNHFKQASQFNELGQVVSGIEYPKHGDILQSSHNNTFYEVVEVKDRVEMFLERSHVWDIILKPLEMNNHKISKTLEGDEIERVFKSKDILEQNDLIDKEFKKIKYESVEIDRSNLEEMFLTSEEYEFDLLTSEPYEP